MARNQKTKILAIDPGIREMGIAFLEEWELMDYAVKTIKRGKNHRQLFLNLKKLINRLIDEKKPEVIALEKNNFSQIKSNLLLTKAIAKIKLIAKRKRVPFKEYNPRTVRKIVCNNGNATKKELARVVALQYPELKVYLESDKKWKIRYWQNIFDAIAVGLTFLSSKH